MVLVCTIVWVWGRAVGRKVAKSRITATLFGNSQRCSGCVTQDQEYSQAPANVLPTRMPFAQ